jgi:hypothetical protein
VGGARHIAARVYAGNFDPGTLGDDPTLGDNLIRIIFVMGQTYWQIDEIPVEALGSRKLVLWYENDDGYSRMAAVNFSANSSGSTYCEAYPSLDLERRLGRRARLRDWSRMPDRWHFTLAGCSNQSCSNCSYLNGDWIVTRDQKSSKMYHWYQQLDSSFVDPRQSSFWRLLFNDNDGYWYLDCAGNLEQMPGSWISYRLHASAWDPEGPNVMHLINDSGYCNVPSAIRIIPV